MEELGGKDRGLEEKSDSKVRNDQKDPDSRMRDRGLEEKSDNMDRSGGKGRGLEENSDSKSDSKSNHPSGTTKHQKGKSISHPATFSY